MKFAISMITVTATAILLASQSYAADLYAPKTVVAPASKFTWTGFHIGIGGGAEFMSAHTLSSSTINRDGTDSGIDSTSLYFGEHSSAASAQDLGKFGMFGTVQVGADYQMNSIVVGAFADFNFGHTKAKSSIYGQGTDYYHTSSGYTKVDTANTLVNTSVTLGNSWDIGARAGFTVNERNLVYVLGGYTSADIRLHQDYTQFGIYDPPVIQNDAFISTDAHKWKSGFIIGAGWETALTDNITLKTEYRYANYGSITSAASDGDPTYGGYGNNGHYYFTGAKTSVTDQSVRLLLSYKY